MDKLNSINTVTIEQIVDRAVLYLKNWTHNELNAILKKSVDERQPIIVNLKNQKWLVGNYLISQYNQRWWKLKHRFTSDEQIFSNKLSAIYYAYHYQIGYLARANNILKEDDDVSRLLLKTEQYKQRFLQAKKKKNLHKIDLFFTRYQESALKLSASKNLLEKTLRSAKYIKF
jgi:hypothetical protein